MHADNEYLQVTTSLMTEELKGYLLLLSRSNSISKTVLDFSNLWIEFFLDSELNL